MNFPLVRIRPFPFYITRVLRASRVGCVAAAALWTLTCFLGGAPLTGQSSAPGEPIVPLLEAFPTAPAGTEGLDVWEEARRASGRRILVSLAERRLWLVDELDVVFTAPVAVGKPVVLEYDGQVWNFTTPRGRRQVIAKQENPVWTPPDWHYVELALAQGWKLERVERGRGFPLSDGSRVTVRNRRIGRVLRDGSFVPVRIGDEAVFEGILFVPPLDSENRRIPGELGRFKIDLGEAYYIHGTPDERSIGTATTHGCIRVRDRDLEQLYGQVEPGTPVFLY